MNDHRLGWTGHFAIINELHPSPAKPARPVAPRLTEEQQEANRLLDVPPSINGATQAAGTLTPRALRDLEQAAFEVWLADESPSGDVEAVQRQWEVSDAYADFLEAHCPPQQKEEDGLVAGRVYLYQGTYGKHYRKVFADGFGAACASAKEADAETWPLFFRERDEFAVKNIRAGLIREATPEELAS